MTDELSPEDSARLDKIMGRYGMESARVRATASQAATVAPDQYAEHVRTAQRLGVPVGWVTSNPALAKADDTARAVSAAAAKSPVLARKYSDEDFARLASDEPGLLTQIGETVRNIGKAGLSGLQNASAGVVGVAQAPVELLNATLPGAPLQGTANWLNQYRQGIEAQAKANTPQADGNLAQGFYSGVQSLASNLAALPLAVVNPAAGMTAMVAPVGGQAYGQARDQGVGVVPAATFGLSQAAIEYATEKIPLHRLIGDVKAGTGIVKTLAKQAALEVPGEEIATALQDLNEWAVLPENADKSFKDYLAARPDAAVQTLIATLVGTGGNVAVVKGIDAAMRRLQTQDAAQLDASKLTEAFQAASESKLRERSPEQFRQVLTEMADGATVRFDGRALVDALAQSGMTPQQIDQALPSVREQLAEAAATGGEVSIPVGELIAGAVGTPLEQSLQEHARIGDNEMSQAEAKEAAGKAEEFLKQEAERVLSQAQEQEATRAESEQVYQTVLDALNTAGRTGKGANEAYAKLHQAFFTAMAGRLGTTPMELFKQFDLKVQAQGANGEALAQGGDLASVKQEWDAAGIKHAVHEKNGVITVGQIVVPEGERGAGKGTAAMRSLLAYADRTGQRVALTPSADFGGTKSRLVKFYKGLGFKENKGRSRDFEISEGMLREPQALAQSSRFSEDNRLSNLNPNGASWQRIREQNPALANLGPDDEVTIYRATIGDTIRPDDFVAVNKKTLATELKNVKARDKSAKIIEQRVKVRDLLMGNDASEFVYYPEGGPQAGTLAQGPLGTFSPSTNTITLLQNANLSTFLHESGHFFLEVMSDLASRENAPVQVREDFEKLLNWFGVKGESAPVTTLPVDSVPHRLELHAKTIGDLLVGQPVGAEANGVIRAEPFIGVFGEMAGAVRDPQVLQAVVRALPVDVVNVLGSEQGAAERVLHDEAMLKDAFTVASDGDVSVPVDKAQQLAALVRVVASASAEAAGVPNVGRASGEGGAAMGASQVGHVSSGFVGQQDRTAVDVWRSMTLDEKRAYHERFAESWEQYLFEGKAPSVELQPVFRRFREFLKRVYTSLKDFLAGRSATPGGQSAGAYEQSGGDFLKGDDGKPLTLYHGSPTRKAGAKFDLSNTGKRTDYGNLGTAVYLTPAEFVAKAYAGRTGSSEAFRVADGQVLRVPYDENYQASLEQVGRELGVTATAQWKGAGQVNPEWSAQFAERAQAAGYVAAGGTNNDGSFAELAVFNPANLQRADGGTLAQTDAKNPLGLTDEVRGVFDRMLASDEAIAEAEQMAGMLPDEDATATAQEKLTARSLRDMKWLDNARSAALKKLQAEAKAVRQAMVERVTAEVDATPEFAAKRDLDKIRKETKSNPDDMQMAVVADAHGFADVNTMLESIAAAGSRRDLIEGITDQRMLEEHGELVDERAMREAANAAIHTQARAKIIATELAAQAEMLKGKGRATATSLAAAAKSFGESVIARTKVGDLKRAAWQHTQAERRAARAWTEATAKADTQAAVQAKQDQMLQNAAARAAAEAQEQVGKTLDFFKRVAKGNNDKLVKGGRDPDIANAARAVLHAYGMETATTKTAAEYLEAVKTHDPALAGVLEPMVAAATANAKRLDALTTGELQALRDEIESMWHLAKRSRQMEVDGNLIDIQEAEEDLRAAIEAAGVPDRIPGEGAAITPRETAMRALQFAGAITRRVESWAEALDGKFGGAALRLIFRPIKQAAEVYRAERTQYRRELLQLIDQIAPTMRRGLIDAPELGYTFGKGHNSVGLNELLHAILHTGNDSNKRKLLLGRGWATETADGTLNTAKWDAFVKRVTDTGVLEKAHWDFAQGVWDLLEKTKGKAQKAHRDVFGRYFAEVTANPVDTPFGTYRGGYVPAQTDPRLATDDEMRKLAEEENQAMSYAFPGTSKGFTKSRVEYNKPLMLDLNTIAQHIDKVVLFSNMEPAHNDVKRLLMRKGVSTPLSRAQPAAYEGMLIPWLARSARQVVETPIAGDGRLSRILSAARARAGMSLMFANVSNTVQQVTGFSEALVKVSKGSMLQAMGTYIAHPKQTSERVAALSPYMAQRMDEEIAHINAAMHEILVNPNVYERAQAWTQKHAYFLQQAVDNTTGPIVWTAAYNDALAKGMSEQEAVHFADGTIRQTQGSTLPEDVSRIETGPAYARIFTQFIGYFNRMANTNATALIQLSREMGLKKGMGRALGIVGAGALVPIWVAEAIAMAFKGGPDDPDGDGYLDDWLQAVIGMGTIKGMLAMVPFGGPLGQVAVNKFNDNPADDRMSLSPAVSMLESALGAPASVYKAATSEDGTGKAKATRDVLTAISMATGLPAFAIGRPAGYLAGIADESVEPTSAADMARGLVTGVASPASKTN